MNIKSIIPVLATGFLGMLTGLGGIIYFSEVYSPTYSAYFELLISAFTGMILQGLFSIIYHQEKRLEEVEEESK